MPAGRVIESSKRSTELEVGSLIDGLGCESCLDRSKHEAEAMAVGIAATRFDFSREPRP